jgi:hypothetical protein
VTTQPRKSPVLADRPDDRRSRIHPRDRDRLVDAFAAETLREPGPVQRLARHRPPFG